MLAMQNGFMSEPTRVVELRVRKSAIRVQAVQVQEENMEEAAVNKREGRDNAANLKGMMQ
jgi:hypothetical protein